MAKFASNTLSATYLCNYNCVAAQVTKLTLQTSLLQAETKIMSIDMYYINVTLCIMAMTVQSTYCRLPKSDRHVS